MKKYFRFLTLVLAINCSFNCFAQDSISIHISEVEQQVSKVNARVSAVNSVVNSQKQKIDSIQSTVETIAKQLNITTDKVNTESNRLGATIDETKSLLESNTNSLSSSIESQSLWGIIIALVVIVLGIVVFIVLHKRISSGSSDISKLRKAQDALKNAQDSLAEESVKLDNKLVELLEKQMAVANPDAQQSQSEGGTQSEVDHTLALKVADEIVRIEMNLSKMDSAVKGHKQLSKAVERIKNNFSAKGYEIVDMLGKPYDDKMKVVANFVTDENLKEGEQIITGIIKPQINYNGVMIQAAQITVSQSE